MIVTLVPDGDTALHRIAHLASYAQVGACVLRNLHVRFIWVVALEAAGLTTRSGEFANSDLVEGANLAFLGDVFAIPDSWPAANVFSLGDVVMVAGAFLALHAATGSRLALRLSPSWQARLRSSDVDGACLAEAVPGIPGRL